MWCFRHEQGEASLNMELAPHCAHNSHHCLREITGCCWMLFWFESLPENDLCLMSCDALTQPEPFKQTELTWFVVLVILFIHSFVSSLIFFLPFFLSSFPLCRSLPDPPTFSELTIFYSSIFCFPIFLLLFFVLDLSHSLQTNLIPLPT